MYILIALLVLAVSAWLISIKSKEAYEVLVANKEETAASNERTVKYNGRLKLN